MCRRSLVWFAALFFASLAFCQTQDQQKFKVSGSVVNSATGEPVRGAMVQMNGPQHQVIMSGNDGRFEFAEVPAGQVFINAHRPGFLADQKQQQFVTVGPDVDSLVLKLSPLSRISGQILDSDGEPIDGLPVMSLQESINAGRKQFHGSKSAVTDETGRFLIDDLQPGTYMLRTGQKPLYIAVNPKSEASRYIYPATYYPDGNSRELAQRFEVGSGQDLKIDMTVRSVRAAHVSLTTVPAFPFVMAGITTSDQQGQESFTQVNKATGVLTLAAVPPGSWKLFARGGFGGDQGGAPNMYGELPIEVRGADIENLKVPLYSLPDIPIVQSGGSASVQLVADNAQTIFGGMGQNADSTKLMGVPPGTYRVIAKPMGKGCISSITAGSQNLLREDLVVSSGASVPPIEVAVTDNCPTLTVMVNSKTQAFVIVTNFQNGVEPQLFQVSGGSATLSNLTPGSYSVFAFDDMSDLEYANPEAMRNFKSQTVELEGGHETSVQLELNERRAK